jgi:hypothetical protein
MADILPVNKSVTFYTPLKKIVRTGTIGEGSCLVHSVLRAIDKKYIKLSIIERMEYVKNIRRNFGKITKADWESMSNGLVSVISYQENFLLLLKTFYIIVKDYDRFKNNIKNTYIKNIVDKLLDNKSSIDTYKYIIDNISIDTFEKTLLPDSYKKAENKPILYSKLEIVNQSLIYFAKSDYEDHLREMILVISEQAEKLAYDKYINDVSDKRSFMDTTNIEILSNKFERDIYFIDGNTRIPYRGLGEDNIKNRKSIVVIWVNKIHYEIAGILLDDNKIQRDFEPTHPFIVKIKTFLYNPWLVSEKYPDLKKYLPKEYKI